MSRRQLPSSNQAATFLSRGLVPSSGWSIVGMDGYVQVLAEHLLEEEREVLHVWLLMDREAYAHYRRELPFFYQVMY